MIGKLIVHQPTRQEAIACMKRALRELRIEGIQTTVPRHLEILDHPAFLEPRVDTTFIERTWPERAEPGSAESAMEALAAGATTD